MSGSDLKYLDIPRLKMRLRNAQHMKNTWSLRVDAIKDELMKHPGADKLDICFRCHGNGTYEFDKTKHIKCNLCEGTGVVELIMEVTNA